MDKPEPLFLRTNDLSKAAEVDMATVNACLYYGVIAPDAAVQHGKKLAPLYLASRKEELVKAIGKRKRMAGTNGARRIGKRPSHYDGLPVFMRLMQITRMAEVSYDWIMRSMWRGTLVPDGYVEFGPNRLQPLFYASRKQELLDLAAQPAWLEKI